MPMMPPRRCPRCQQLVAGRCEACIRRADVRRGSAAQRGYCSARWRKLRRIKLETDPLCSVCGSVATEVDHLRPHAGPDDPLCWQWSNLDSKCKSCHSRKTATVDSGFARKATDRDSNITGTTASPNRSAGCFQPVQNNWEPVIG
jgi:5-methylcytosine-specific restriction enzyme A